MNDTIIKMKDGRMFCSPIWEFNPKGGYVSLIDTERINDGHPIDICLDDVEYAIEKNVRFNAKGETRDENLLERARNNGWVQKVNK
jgi:hypothetical protein